MAKADICVLPTDEFTKHFFKLLKLQTTENIQLDDSVINGLTSTELDELARQYLDAEIAIEYIDKKCLKAIEKEESNQERLKKVISNIVFDQQKSAAEFAKKIAPLSLPDDLRASILKTQGLINSPFSGLTGIKTMSDFLNPLGGTKTASELLNMGAGRQTGIIENQIDPMPRFVAPPNPAFETNELLEELSHGIEQIATLAERQAETFKSLAETANMSLTVASSSSIEAQKTTLITKRGVFIAIAALAATITISCYQIWDAGQQSDKLINKLGMISTQIDNQTKAENQNSAAMIEQIKELKDAQNRSSSNLNPKARSKKPITANHEIFGTLEKMPFNGIKLNIYI